MSWYFAVFIFIVSCLLLSWLSSRLIKSLIQIGRYLRWREFIITFFVMAFATSLPNFFVAFSAAIRGLPEIALGDIIGGNLIDMTLVLAIAVFFSRKGISSNSGMVQKSATFTSIIAVLPLFLIWDSTMSRLDGAILILAFGFYAWWVFSEKSRFTKTYNGQDGDYAISFRIFLSSVAKMIVLIILLLAASYFVISSAQYFSNKMGISLALTAILIVGLGNAFPEMYFSIVSARKKENWMALGELMGSVTICATLVLGSVALIFPFQIKDLSPFLIARVFLIIAAILSLIFIRSGKKITKKEGLFLLIIYITFLLTEIFIK